MFVMNKTLSIYTFLIISFLYIPIIILAIYSFSSDPYSISLNSFSLDAYIDLYNDRSFISAIWNSVIVAIIASTLAITITIPLVYILHKKKNIIAITIKSVSKWILIVPDISVAIGIMILFKALNFNRGLETIIISHTTFSIAYTILIIEPHIESIVPKLTNAAMDLGATEIQVITSIIIPLITPNLIVAFCINFTLSWDDFIFSFFNSSAGNSTLSVYIYTLIKKGANPSINAISIISMIVSLIFITISIKFQRILNKI